MERHHHHHHKFPRPIARFLQLEGGQYGTVDAAMMAYAMARTALLVTYDADGKPIAQGRATGFFLDAGDRGFVVTNTHVLEAFCARRKAGDDVRVQVSVENGAAGPETHAGYLLMPQEAQEEEGIRSLYAFKDVGLVELTPETVEIVRRRKKFVTLGEVTTAIPEPPAEVIYRGYPRDNVEFHSAIRGVWAEAWTHFTQVVRSTPRNITMDRREGRIVFGSGATQAARDLHGISGSALFDRDGLLRGVVWGGDDEGTWVCPSHVVLECVAKYAERRAS